jgi:hypothetical protein
MAEFTDKERFFQLLEEHYDLTLQFLRSKAKDVSQVELVSYDTERMTGVLTVFNWEGVKKIVSVSPESLVQTLTSLNEDLRERCEAAAQSAETAASFANTQGQFASAQGAYAKQQGDRALQLIESLTSIGLTVEAQGQAAVDAMNEVIAWYSPFRQNAESWYSGMVREVGNWFSQSKSQWTEWFNGTCNQWLLWYGEIASAWATWFADTKDGWSSWFAARKAEWTAWWNETTSAWSLWFAARKSEWNTWYDGVVSRWNAFFERVNTILSGWEQKEQERQSAEEIRQELAAHPPIPSERGYWKFWSLETTPHQYVESGYSSRGTLDWPEFFWDYETMGVGVITTRDYSRFFIDEQGRFGMLM